jgi:hypothetical protein
MERQLHSSLETTSHLEYPLRAYLKRSGVIEKMTYLIISVAICEREQQSRRPLHGEELFKQKSGTWHMSNAAFSRHYYSFLQEGSLSLEDFSGC